MKSCSESPRVLIAGGAGGVGLACAEAFAERGAALILTDWDGVALTRAAERFDAFSRYCDAIGSASVELLAQELAGLFPSIDVLINAAGRGYVRTLAMARMTQALLPMLRRASGARLVVNIASTGALAPAECMFPYASSPDAFEKLSGMFKEQLKGTAIDVVAVAPRHWPAAASTHWSDRLARRQDAEEKAIAERIVGMVAASRPCWKHRPPEVPRRA